MPNKSSSATDIKENSLVWILYRKQPWPALVKRIYGKKLTYNFLPVEKHPVVFNTATRNVRPFLETDKLPDGSNNEQRDAYNIAMVMLHGEFPSTEDVATASKEKTKNGASDNPAKKPAAKQAKGKKALVVAKDSDVSMSEENSASDTDDNDDDQMDAQAAKMVEYHPGDVVIVNTDKGMWPVKITKLVDDDKVIYQMFPLESFPENGQTTEENVIEFPVDQVDKLIADNKGTPSLCEAFKSVKRYLNLDLKEKDDESEDEPKLKKSKRGMAVETNLEDKKAAPAPLRMYNKKKAVNSTKSALNEKAENESNEPKRILRKRRHIPEVPEMEEEPNDCALSPDSSADIGTKPESDLSQERPSASTSLKDKRTNSEDVHPDSTNNTGSEKSKKTGAKATSELPSAPVTRKRLGMNRTANTHVKSEVSQSKSKDEPITVKNEAIPPSSTQVKSKPPEFMAVLLSDDAAAYLNGIWSAERKALRSASLRYTAPTSVAEMDVEFRTLSAFFNNVEDLQTAMTEIHKWTQLCPKLPNMSLLKEIHYIVNVALPEACIFALSKTKKCSLSDAADKFLRMTSEKSENSSGVRDKKSSKNAQTTDEPNLKSGFCNGTSNDDAVDSSTNKKLSPDLDNGTKQLTHKRFDDLLLAATIMQDKEQKEKSNSGNGTSDDDKNDATFNSSYAPSMVIAEDDDDEN